MREEFTQWLIPPKIAQVSVKSIVFILLGLFLLCGFLPWYVFSSGSGRVTAVDPNERIQEVTAPVSGFIEKWHVKEGSVVKKGQPLVDLVDADPSLMVRIEREKQAAQAAVNSTRLAHETALLNVRRQENLLRDGLTSRKEFEKAKIEATKLESELAKAMATLTKAETQVSRQQTQSVVAPRDGNVLRIIPGEGNQLIKGGDPLIIFAPVVTQTSVEIWISGNDLPFIEKGQSARVQFEGWPSVQVPGWPSVSIGTFDAEVYLVDFASSYQGKFRVLLIPKDGPWPSMEFVRLNSQARGIIHIRRTIVAVELWRQVNSFPLSQAPIKDELAYLLKKKKDNKTEEKK